MNSNYYRYSCVILVLFANNAPLITSYDSYTDVPVDDVEFINFRQWNHPMQYCKSKMGLDAIWIGYYDEVIPSDICNRHISCRANDIPDQEFIDVYPKTGARCQRRTQNEYYNFGYGCYERRCVPIICMDDHCKELLDLDKDRKKSMVRFLPDQRAPPQVYNWYETIQSRSSSVKETHHQSSSGQTLFDDALTNSQIRYTLPNSKSTGNIIRFTSNRNSSEPVL